MPKKELTSGDKVVVVVDGVERNGEVRAVKPAVKEADLPLQYVVSVDLDHNERVLTVAASDVTKAKVVEAAPVEEAPAEEEAVEEEVVADEPVNEPEQEPEAPAAEETKVEDDQSAPK